MSDIEADATGRSRYTRLSIVVLVAVVAVGVVSFSYLRDEATSAGLDTATAPVGSGDPEKLVGTWWSDAPDSLSGWLVVISPTGELGVVDDDCAVDGSWDGSPSGLAVFHTWGAGGECGGVLEAMDQWFSGVQWFRTEGDETQLLDTNGEVAMTLTPAPEDQWPVGVREHSYLLEGMDEKYQRDVTVVPLPSGVQVPPRSELVDIRWEPLDLPVSDGMGDMGADGAFIRFGASGYWTGSDGCNGQGGAWAIHPETGEILATSGVSTLMGCANVPVAEAVAGSEAVGLDGGELVFYDAEGLENGRFAAAQGQS